MNRLPPSFAQFPVEALLAVFTQFTTFTDVHALAAVSKRMQGVFDKYKVYILRTVALNSSDLRTAGRQLIRARALVQTFDARPRSEQTPQNYSTALHSFMKAEVYNPTADPTRPNLATPLTNEDVPELLFIWRVASAIEPVIFEQVVAAESSLQQIGLWKEDYRVPTEVTPEARKRIHNAVYRMWCYQILFYHTQYTRPSEEAGAMDNSSPHIIYLKSLKFSLDDINLAELVELWRSIINNRLFPDVRFLLAVEVAAEGIVFLDQQGEECYEARGRVFTKKSSIVNKFWRPAYPQRKAPRFPASNETIRTVTFINQWSTAQWTMRMYKMRLKSLRIGLTRMLTPPDILAFTNPGRSISYDHMRALGTRVSSKFDTWDDPATGRGTMERYLNNLYEVTSYSSWGSTLFMLDGTRVRVFRSGPIEFGWRVGAVGFARDGKWEWDNPDVENMVPSPEYVQ